MDYRVEVYDTWGRRILSLDEVPLLKVTRRAADQRDVIEGVLPGRVTDLGHGYRVRVLVEGPLFCEAQITRVRPVWSDTRKLILDRFVHFHEVVKFEAEREAREGNTQVSRAYMNRTVSQIARDAVNSALGEVHYWVDHSAYPDGAVREYGKLSARMNAGNELEVGGIAVGQWVGSARMDLTGACAKEGDTIAGLKVDGADWPDLRLMLVDSEETSKNSHGISMHPEIAGWTTDEYDASGYKLAGDRAKVFLQDLIDLKGIDFIELNPHRDSTGAFDDRVDAYGRYLGLVYGGGECFNAALVEEGHASVFLYGGGKFLDPDLELKDFFSYAGAHSDSIEDSAQTFEAYDVTNGVYEVLTALA